LQQFDDTRAVRPRRRRQEPRECRADLPNIQGDESRQPPGEKTMATAPSLARTDLAWGGRRRIAPHMPLDLFAFSSPPEFVLRVVFCAMWQKGNNANCD
jgi:hypothetical protein